MLSSIIISQDCFARLRDSSGRALDIRLDRAKSASNRTFFIHLFRYIHIVFSFALDLDAYRVTHKNILQNIAAIMIEWHIDVSFVNEAEWRHGLH